MKRIFTLLLAAVATMAASATDYNEVITVTINGESTEQMGTINVTQNGEGTYDLTLRNFMLNSEDGPMGVGNIEINGIAATHDGNTLLLATKRDITITPGDDPQVAFWMATMLPPVPVDLRAKLEDDHLRCYIDIDLQQQLQQVIQVAVGQGYQMLNAGFEDWHTTTGEYMEPNRWHSFESASGSLAALAGHHIGRSTTAHTGLYAARIFATSIFGIVANGTMTTGRMNAGSMIAADTQNHAYADVASNDTDANGDPFYMPLYSRPDALALWVRFKQGTANADHPYATVSAVITDGTRYQDPEDKEYQNVIARAKNNTIAVTGDEWVRIEIPFEYTTNTAQPKALLVTVSTNAEPGQGSNGDEVLVDDISLIYNATATAITVKGAALPNFSTETKSYEVEAEGEVTADDIAVTTAGRSVNVTKTVQTVDEGNLWTITLYSGDMKTASRYTLLVRNGASGIHAVRGTTGGEQHFTLDGRRADTSANGGIVIVRQADGTVRKLLR